MFDGTSKGPDAWTQSARPIRRVDWNLGTKCPTGDFGPRPTPLKPLVRATHQEGVKLNEPNPTF